MKILLPIDGSKFSLKATKYIVKLLKKSPESATVTLINVKNDLGLNFIKNKIPKSAIEDYLHETSMEELKMSKKILDLAGIQYEVVMKRGKVADEIIKEHAKISSWGGQFVIVTPKIHKFI